jgi:superfamily II DNA or RNA helicase
MNQDLFFTDDEINYQSSNFPEPRPFQSSAHEKLREHAKQGHRCQVIMAPTGAGKSYLGLRIIHEALKRGKSAMFICDRTTLIEQTSNVADTYGLSAHSIIQSNHWRYRPSMKFHIASVQTLARRQWPDVDVIVIDECHAQYTAWVEHIKTCRANVVGLSATPFSKGLGQLFSNLINAATMHDLVQSGVLVPMRVMSCTKVDMTGVETRGGEWTDSAAATRGMEIVGDVVSEWVKYASGMKTIVFGATIAHCEEMEKAFNQAGIPAAVFTSETQPEERAELLKEYKKSKHDTKLLVLISIEALAKGFDCADVECVCDVRPLRKSLSTAIQMWGRGLRSSPETGKYECIAGGSLVLTDRGLVAIESILLYDKVWDGYEFVAHKGVISRGKKQVITYAGLTATPDHRVKTKEGWCAFGDCANQQTPIVTTGIGRSAIWARENYFTGGNSSRCETQHAPACIGRLRDVWVSFVHSVFEPHKRCVEGLPLLQQTSENTAMASVEMRRNGTSVQKSERCSVGALRWARYRVSVFWANCLRSMDCGKSRASREREGFGAGQDKQRWTLRTREYSLGNATDEYVEQNCKPVGTVDAQIHDRTSRNQIRRSYASFFYFIRNVIRGYCRQVSQAVVQTEREVWDILDCGPRNSFTCEGLLVHNCILLDFSGNIIRFKEDFEDIYFNGLASLDSGEKLDKTVRKDDEEEKPESQCPSCGNVPFAKKCMKCGYEKKVQSLIEHVPGVMQEVMIGKAKAADNPKNLYEMCCTYARQRGKPETQQGYAYHLYRDIMGSDPKWNFDSAPNTPISKAVMNQIISRNIKYSRSLQKNAR